MPTSGCRSPRVVGTLTVKVTADDGTVGYGAAHHGQNPTAMAAIIQGGIGTLVAGSDPFDAVGIWEPVRHQQVQTRALGAGSVIALSGIHIALWNLKGKLLGQPDYRLLGEDSDQAAPISIKAICLRNAIHRPP